MTSRLIAVAAVWFVVANAAHAEDASTATPEAAEPVALAESSAPATVAESPDATPQSVLLRYKYAPNQVLRYAITDETTLEIAAGSEAATMNYSSCTWKHLRVKSATDGGRAVLELVLDRVQMQAEGPAGKTEFDSRKPGLPPAEFAHIVEYVGRPIADLTVTASGRVTDLRDPGQKTATAAAVPAELLERDSTGPIVFPEQPVAIGERWTEQFDVPVSVGEGTLTKNVKLQRAYTLISVEADVATIELDTIVLTPIQDASISAQLIQRTPSGIILFDLQQGVILSRRTFLSNQVVGHEGAASKLKVVRSYVERLTTEDESLTAQR